MKFLSVSSLLNSIIGFCAGVMLMYVQCFWWSGAFYIFGAVCLLMGIQFLIQPKE